MIGKSDRAVVASVAQEQPSVANCAAFWQSLISKSHRLRWIIPLARMGKRHDPVAACGEPLEIRRWARGRSACGVGTAESLASIGHCAFVRIDSPLGRSDSMGKIQIWMGKSCFTHPKTCFTRLKTHFTHPKNRYTHPETHFTHPKTRYTHPKFNFTHRVTAGRSRTSGGDGLGKTARSPTRRPKARRLAGPRLVGG